jgi:hypothetical protein
MRPDTDREQRARLRRIILWMAAIPVAEFALGTRGHA